MWHSLAAPRKHGALGPGRSPGDRGPTPCVIATAAARLHLKLAMQPEHTEGVFTPGCEPVVEDDERRRLLWLMAEYFRTLGCTDIKARLPGFVPPPVLSGTIEDHRPDFTCRQADTSKTPIILEVVTPAAVGDPRAENRWSLLSSAAKLYNAELHFVVPKWHASGAIDPQLRRRLARMELTPSRVWNV